jgi:hypothetical protein
MSKQTKPTYSELEAKILKFEKQVSELKADKTQNKKSGFILQMINADRIPINAYMCKDENDNLQVQGHKGNAHIFSRKEAEAILSEKETQHFVIIES